MDCPLQEYPIDGILDLHVFSPKEVSGVVREYLRECRQRGLLHVRIIHGKGRSVLRGRVHRLLSSHPAVVSFSMAGDRSGWGATLVVLSPPESAPQ